MKKTVLILPYLLFSVLTIWGQTDTLFWFAAPELSQGVFANRFPPLNQEMDRPIQLRITTYAQPATVTISQPAGTGGTYMPPQIINIPAGGTHSLNLTAWIDSLECKPADRVLNYGLKITSTAPVSIYYEIVSAVCLCAPTIFVLKGQNALGTDFLIPSQNFVDNGYHAGTVVNTDVLSPPPYSSFDIVATENNTTVTIIPASNIVGHVSGSAITINLNSGQTYSATAAGFLPGQRLNGSKVTSDKPIAITYKDDLMRDNSLAIYPGGCGDPGGDQIVPIPMLGTEYIAIKGNLNGPGDQLFVSATSNATDIFQDGVLAATINAGQTHRLPMPGAPGTATYVRTSNAVSVLQLTGYGCEMDVAMVPKNNCDGGSSRVSFVRAVAQPLYLHLTVKNGGQGDFLVNGVSGVITAGQFTAVPGTAGQWYAAQVLLSPTQYVANSVINVENTSARFHLGMFNGLNQPGAGGARFGYFSNFGQINAKAHASANQVCKGMQIELFADTVAGATYSWSGPNGYSSLQQNPVIPNAPLAHSGVYTLSIDVPGCLRSSDTVLVTVFDYPEVHLGNDTAICSDSLTLQPSSAYPGATYLWSNASAANAITVKQSGSYWLQITQNDCMAADTIEIDLNAKLEVSLGDDTGICSTDLPLTLESTQPPGTNYAWSTGLTGTNIQVNYSGEYWLHVWRNNCEGSDTIIVEVVPDPNLNIGSDSTICEQFPLRIGTVIPEATYLWNTGATSSYIQVNSTDQYILEANLRGCRVWDTIVITAMPIPEIDLGPDDDICPEQTIMLNATYGNNSSYLWNTGDTTSTYAAVSAGIYSVRVISEYRCVGIDTIQLQYYPKPTVMLGADTSVCEETPLTLSVWQINADSLLWSGGSSGNTLSIKNAGQYIVTGINKCGTCADTILVKQQFCDIWVPNAFTPNNDGKNDVFKVLGNLGRLEGFSLGIFNRWGQRIFYTEDKYKGWDGTQDNVQVLLGTYIYLLQYNMDGKPFQQQGNFHLIR